MQLSAQAKAMSRCGKFDIFSYTGLEHFSSIHQALSLLKGDTSHPTPTVTRTANPGLRPELPSGRRISLQEVDSSQLSNRLYLVTHRRSRSQEIPSAEGTQASISLGSSSRREKHGSYDTKAKNRHSIVFSNHDVDPSWKPFLKDVTEEMLKKEGSDGQSRLTVSSRGGPLPPGVYSGRPMSAFVETSRTAKRHSMLLFSPYTNPPGKEVQTFI
jgi:hypothetical protein